jgi:hypothetical protein
MVIRIEAFCASIGQVFLIRPAEAAMKTVPANSMGKFGEGNCWGLSIILGRKNGRLSAMIEND